ncbi:hypothetical protein [Bradyrhizobium sp. Leo121]|uniref:hypothetical protein n=1 Tax=Bradyrhizobium sp. Leo121 TaxID=1571195 RepID=UPI001029686F|nr:hypothetical protein [Bradyrhizobium sp. Leo121]
MMKVETFTIPIVRTPASDGMAPLELIEAMSAVAAARSTQEVIKAYEAAGVTGNLIVPFVADCPVDPGALGRAMRRAWKAALAAAERGDSILIELQPKKDVEVIDIIVGPAAGVRPDKP